MNKIIKFPDQIYDENLFVSDQIQSQTKNVTSQQVLLQQAIQCFIGLDCFQLVIDKFFDPELSELSKE